MQQLSIRSLNVYNPDAPFISLTVNTPLGDVEVTLGLDSISHPEKAGLHLSVVMQSDNRVQDIHGGVIPNHFSMGSGRVCASVDIVPQTAPELAEADVADGEAMPIPPLADLFDELDAAIDNPANWTNGVGRVEEMYPHIEWTPARQTMAGLLLGGEQVPELTNMIIAGAVAEAASNEPQHEAWMNGDLEAGADITDDDTEPFIPGMFMDDDEFEPLPGFTLDDFPPEA